MEKERNLLINIVEEVSDYSINGISFSKGKIGIHQVYIAKCGIGKVNSALNTFRLITIINPDLIINSGVAGGAGIPIGSVMIADSVAYWDVWCGPGTTYGQTDGNPLFFLPDPSILGIAGSVNSNIISGLICSGDKFITSANEINYIKSHFPSVIAVDMESASIAQTCLTLNIPFAIIRVVSDTPGMGENIEQYKNFWAEAPLKTFNVIKSILLKLDK